MKQLSKSAPHAPQVSGGSHSDTNSKEGSGSENSGEATSDDVTSHDDVREQKEEVELTPEQQEGMIPYPNLMLAIRNEFILIELC